MVGIGLNLKGNQPGGKEGKADCAQRGGGAIKAERGHLGRSGFAYGRTSEWIGVLDSFLAAAAKMAAL